MRNWREDSGTVWADTSPGRVQSIGRGIPFLASTHIVTDLESRCTFRNAPINKGDNVYLPGCWPQPPEDTTLEPVSGVADMRKEDLEEASGFSGVS